MKKKVIYVQEDSYSCGSICIQSLVAHYGGYIPLETVLDDTSTDTTGTNAYEMILALRKYGFTSYGRKIALKDIEDEDLPAIAHIQKNGLEHFVVIYKIEETCVIVMDPEVGEKHYSKVEFLSLYDEKAIFAYPNGEIPHFKKKSPLLNKIFNVLFSNKSKVLIIWMLCFLTMILSLALNFHFKLLDKCKHPIVLTIIFIAVSVFFEILTVIKNRIIRDLLKSTDSFLTKDYIKHVFSIPRRYLARKRTGEILKKVQDASSIKDISLQLILTSSFDFLSMTISVVVMFIISKRTSIIYLSISLITTSIMWFENKKLYKKNKENIQKYETYIGTLVENLSGLESIKNLNREDIQFEKISSKLDDYNENKRKLGNYLDATREVKNLVMSIGFLIANLVGFLNLSEDFTFYDLITLQSLFGIMTSSLMGFVELSNDISKSRAVERNISEFLDIEVEPVDALKLTRPLSNVDIKELSYTHDRIHDDLKSIDLHITRGDKILLRGPSGVGKSTLVKCLSGRYEDFKGEILLDGVSIKKIVPRTVRDAITYVGQEEKLFTGTIKENIIDDKIKDDVLSEVLTICQLDEFIASRPRGLDSTILESGQNLSGGERARLILARALYREPDILVVDETLSSVGKKMEDDILKVLLEKKDLTVIYITHRDKQYLFDKIVEL